MGKRGVIYVRLGVCLRMRVWARTLTKRALTYSGFKIAEIQKPKALYVSACLMKYELIGKKKILYVCAERVLWERYFPDFLCFGKNQIYLKTWVSCARYGHLYARVFRIAARRKEHFLGIHFLPSGKKWMQRKHERFRLSDWACCWIEASLATGSAWSVTNTNSLILFCVSQQSARMRINKNWSMHALGRLLTGRASELLKFESLQKKAELCVWPYAVTW